jgi:hypothetical protein
MLWALVIDIYESQTYPVVQHVFYGRTQAEAQGYYESHLKTDEFLRGCVERGRWRQVGCRAEMRWEQVQR